LGYLCDANCIAKIGQMAFVSQRYDAICFANCFASYSMRKSALRKRGRRLEQIANCFASYNMRRSAFRNRGRRLEQIANCFASYNMRRFALRNRGRRLEQIANFFASYNMQRSALRIYAFLLTCCFMGTVQEVQEEDHNCRNDNGPRAWQGASFLTC
jgi:DNA-binding transcriptional regulator WhiA